jgi:hypothetical protein
MWLVPVRNVHPWVGKVNKRRECETQSFTWNPWSGVKWRFGDDLQHCCLLENSCDTWRPVFGKMSCTRQFLGVIYEVKLKKSLLWRPCPSAFPVYTSNDYTVGRIFMDLDTGLNSLLITQKNAALIYLNTVLYPSYMFRRHLHHHQGPLRWDLKLTKI